MPTNFEVHTKSGTGIGQLFDSYGWAAAGIREEKREDQWTAAAIV